MIKEVLPNIFSWSEFSQEKQLNFNGYFIETPEETVFIDPPALSKDELNELQGQINAPVENTLKAILLTNAHHERASFDLKKIFKVPIMTHENDKDLLEFSPDQTFKNKEKLFCGIKVINFEDQKSPGESGFFIEKRKVMILGDALIGKPSGKLNLLPPEKYRDIEKAKEGLEVLKEYDFDTLLVGDGTSIINNARKVVQEFLKK